jgi:hypothetical protein
VSRRGDKQNPVLRTMKDNNPTRMVDTDHMGFHVSG